MKNENQNYDKKSLKLFVQSKIDWSELAKDCVCFANSRGGVIVIGIENNEDNPPPNQIISQDLVDTIKKRISEQTINLGIAVTLKDHTNGGQYIEIKIFPSQVSVASTSNGQYYMRISDHCKPILPDELTRLFTDKPAFIWETKVVQKIKIQECDQSKLHSFIIDIKSSQRISEFVRQKSTEELLSFYQMIEEDYLTNLGVLWLGTREQRARLTYAPVVQFIKYDQNAQKIKKVVWDDFSLNPKELIHSLWEQIPEWKEGIEISEGIFGRSVLYHYNENVVRELLANALVHKPYTMRGDIFINYYPDRLEIHNPGLLPIGVTPKNILHQSVRRNEHLSKIFYDLNLMEREGSGYDKIYEILLSEAKQIPIVEERDDRVVVTVSNNIKSTDVIHLIEKIKSHYNLNQKEIICLGIIAQNKTIIATEFARKIQAKDDKQIKNWLGNLLKYDIVFTKGKTKGTTYFINPEILKGTAFEKTDLSSIQEHRLLTLVLEDLEGYPNSTIKQIHSRIGKEIPLRKLRTCLYKAVRENQIKTIGGKKFRKYFINKKQG